MPLPSSPADDFLHLSRGPAVQPRDDDVIERAARGKWRVCDEYLRHNVLQDDAIDKWLFSATDAVLDLPLCPILAHYMALLRYTRSLVINVLLVQTSVRLGNFRHFRAVLFISNNNASYRCMACVSPILVFHWNCLYLVPFLRYSASKNGVTLKPGVRVVQGHWKWRDSIDHIRLFIGLPS